MTAPALALPPNARVAGRPAADLPLLPGTLTDEEQMVLSLLRTHTYAEVEAMVPGWSRGRIYALAVRTGARKFENRIRERAKERLQRQREFLEATLNTTATADVLDFLDGLPDKSVALHCYSMPYNLGKKYGDCPGADTMSAVYFHGWAMQIISECARTLKDGGVLFFQCGATRDWQDRLMPMDVLLFEDMRRAGLTFQSRIVWTISHGLTPEGRLSERYETVLVFSKGDQPTFNPNAARTPQKYPGKRAFKGDKKGQLSGHPFGAHPSNVWDDIVNVKNNHPERKFGAHPAPFPKALVKRAVLLYTMPGELVCDPFSGSGTTHAGAIETGRQFVGADLFYADHRERRIAATTLDVSTPLPGISDESAAIWQAEARRVDATPARVPSIEEDAALVAMHDARPFDGEPLTFDFG